MSILQIILLSMLIQPGFQAEKVIFTLQPESYIWIEGRTNVNEFQCDANFFEGKAMMENGDSINTNLTIQARIATDSFECGKRRMNRDLFEALKGNDHPHIFFEFIEADIVENSSDYVFTVTGALTAGGVTRVITFDVNGYPQDSKSWRVAGATHISMKDFHIDPPSPLLGLIKVNDQLSVNFDLIVDMNSDFMKNDYYE